MGQKFSHRFELPADSSSVSDPKMMPQLKVMAATLMKLILSGTSCFLCFTQISFSFIMFAFELFFFFLLTQLSVQGQLTLSQVARL